MASGGALRALERRARGGVNPSVWREEQNESTWGYVSRIPRRRSWIQLSNDVHKTKEARLDVEARINR